MPRIRNYEELRDRLVELDRVEASLWISPEWVSKDVNEIFKEKRELALEIIGHQLSDEKFEKMLNNIKTNPELQQLLDDLMDRGRGELIIKFDVIDSFRKAFLTSDPERRKEYIRDSKARVDRYNDMLKYDHSGERDENDNPLPGDEPGIETLAQRKDSLRRKVHENYLNSLKGKVYNEEFVDPYSIDWGSPDVTVGEYKAAASLLVDRDIEVWNYNYSYKKCIDAKRAIDKDIKNLVNNRDFRGYVKETLSKNSTALFEKDAFVSGWDKYQAELKNARENRANPVMFGEKNDPDYWKDPDLDVSGSSKEQAKERANSIIESTVKKGKVFTQKDEMEACDLVIAKVFAGPNFDKTYLVPFGINENGVYTIFNSVLNCQVREMREMLLNDPVFLNTLAERVDRKSFYEIYKASVKREINKTIEVEKRAEKALEKSGSRKAQYNKYLAETMVDISKKKRDFYYEVHDALTEINKSKKKPSKHMKRLMNALEAVVGKDQVSAAALDELNKASLNYYKERQGIFFSPFTDDGKARLDYVEMMIRITDSDMKKVRQDEHELSHPKTFKVKATMASTTKEEVKKSDNVAANEEPKKEEAKASGKRQIEGLGRKMMFNAPDNNIEAKPVVEEPKKEEPKGAKSKEEIVEKLKKQGAKRTMMGK